MRLPTEVTDDRVLFSFLNQEIESSEMGVLRQQAAVEQARSEIRYGNLDHGAELLEGVARHIKDRTDPRNMNLLALAFSVWGQALETWGDTSDAQTYFGQALDQFIRTWGSDLDDAELHVRMGPRTLGDLGLALSGLHDHERAQRILWAGRRLGPSTPEAARRLARYSAAAGSLDEARALLDEALPVLPTDAECWYAMAQVRERGGERESDTAYQRAAALWLTRHAFRQSIPALEHLLELRPDDSTTLTALAEALRRSRQEARAEVLADRAVTLAPGQFEPWLGRALIRGQREKLEEAFEDVDRALKIQVGEPNALVALCDLHLARGELVRSLESARKALDADPQHIPAKVRVGWVLMAQQQFREAREPLLAAHLARPDDVDLAKLYAELAVRLGDTAEVVETLSPLWLNQRLASDDVANFAQALVLEGEYDYAVTVARTQYQTEPDNRDIQRILASALARRAFDMEDDTPAMSAAAEEAAALSPDEPDVQTLRGIISYRQGDVESAEGLLLSALSRAPEHEKALEQLVVLLFDQDRDVDAEAWARVGLEVSDDPYFRLQTASALSRQERHLEALTLLTELPPDLGAYESNWLTIRAEAKEGLGRWDSATEDRTALAQLEPDSPDAWFDLAEASRLAGKWEDAVAASRRALRIQPDHPLARATLGSALAQGGETNEARRELDTALIQDPYYEFALLERTRVSEGVDEALEFATRLAEVSQDPDMLAERGWVLADYGRFADALSAFEGLAARAPENLRVLTGSSLCLSQLGRHDEATSCAQRAVQFHPDDVFALRSLADAYSDSGAWEQALVHLRHAFEMNRDDVDTVGRLAATLVQIDEVGESLTLLDRMANAQSRKAAPWSTLGSHLVGLGYFDQAIPPLQRSIELSGLDPWVHNSLAWALMHADEPDIRGAEVAFLEANRLAPDRLWLMKNLADARHVLRAEQAQTLYRDVLGRIEQELLQDPQMRYLLGWCLFRLGDFGSAGRHLFAAVSNPVDGESTRLDLGLVSLCQGREDHAIHHYDLAISRLGTQAPHRRRGPLRVAQLDLQVACRDWPELEGRATTRQIQQRLTDALKHLPALPLLLSLDPSG